MFLHKWHYKFVPTVAYALVGGIFLTFMPNTVFAISQGEVADEQISENCSQDLIRDIVARLGTSELTQLDFKVLVTCGQQSVAALAEALRHRQSEVRSSAAYTLGRIGADAFAAVPELTIALKDDYLDVRALAAYALGQIGLRAESAIPILGRISGDRREDQVVRESANQALKQMGTEQSLAAIFSPSVSSKTPTTRSLGTCIKFDIVQGQLKCIHRARPTDISVTVAARASSNLPLICQLPGIKTIFPRCK